MKTIAFISQKGGSGKTTLAVHSAVAAHESGERVVLIDTDPQKSATTWSDNRESDYPIVATASPSELLKVLQAARDEGMTLAIIDTAPHAAPEVAKIIREVDLAIIPCRPTAFDIAAIANAINIVKAVNAKYVFVLSACPFRSPEIEETRELLKAEYNALVSPIPIIDRRAFARAIASGKSVTEFEADGKAALEINGFWNWLKEQI